MGVRQAGSNKLTRMAFILTILLGSVILNHMTLANCGLLMFRV
jgi:hypothetical protein